MTFQDSLAWISNLSRTSNYVKAETAADFADNTDKPYVLFAKSAANFFQRFVVDSTPQSL